MSQAKSHIRALVEVGRWAEARAAAEVALSAEPDDVELLAYLSRSAAELGDVTTAEDAARRMVVVAPGNEWGHRLLALRLSDRGQHAAAAASAREAVRLAPGAWNSHLALARVLVEDRRRLEEAFAAACEAVRLAPNQPGAHFILGFVEARRGHTRQAAAAYRETLRLEPDHSMARNNLGVLHGRRAIFSARDYVAALRADPQNAAALRNLHRLIGVLTLNVYAAEAVVFAAAAVLARVYDGPSIASGVLGVALVVAVVGYVVAVVRQVPRGAWRHTTREFGVPLRALWNVVPVTIVGGLVMATCFSKDAVSLSSEAVIPLAIVLFWFVVGRLRRR